LDPHFEVDFSLFFRAAHIMAFMGHWWLKIIGTGPTSMDTPPLITIATLALPACQSKGFSVPIFGHFPGDGFPAIARETPIRVSAIYGPFMVPIFSRIFPLFWSRPLEAAPSMKIEDITWVCFPCWRE
jgi:hypothetical protein